MADRQILAVCFDFGDTLVDEASEVKDESLTTLRAELIPGADRLLKALANRGYRLGLVADGRPGTYRNVLSHYGLYDLFDIRAISEELGMLKPDPRMFEWTLQQLEISQENYSRTVMVGNRLDRDVRGANIVGMISVWVDWSPRYSKVPADSIEEPRYRVREPLEVLGLIDTLEREAGFDRGEQ